jgi:hypothetical protein
MRFSLAWSNGLWSSATHKLRRLVVLLVIGSELVGDNSDSTELAQEIEICRISVSFNQEMTGSSETNGNSRV